MRIAIVGAGIAGLTAALALARSGHAVVILESDPEAAPHSSADMWQRWERRGVPQFRHIHGFHARVRNLLRDNAPDVLQALLAAGAEEFDLTLRIPGGPDGPGGFQPDDRDLVALRCRRPVLEGTLRRIVEREPGVEFRSGVDVEGLLAAPRDPDTPAGPARVTGLRLRGGGQVIADAVVLAGGRRTPLASWLAAIGARAPVEHTRAVGMHYHGRYFELLADPPPAAPGSPGQPRVNVFGELGFLRFVLVWADSPTFVVNFLTPSWDRALRVLHDERAFMAVLPHLPPIAPWLDHQRARPINRVESMGALRNTVRRLIVDAEPVALGLHAIGDALCHTNPALGWGSPLAVTHAFALAGVLKAHPHDTVAQAVAMDERVWPLAWECFSAAVEADESRSRAWRGETTEPATEEDWPRFRATVVARAATLDSVVYRAFWRSVQLLDPPTLLRERPDVLERARRAVADNPPSPQPAAGPPREEFLSIARAAFAGVPVPVWGRRRRTVQPLIENAIADATRTSVNATARPA